MKEIILTLLKCKPTDDLLYIFEVTDYRVINHGSYSEYFIPLNNFKSMRLYECIKNLNVYMQHAQIYLQEYIFTKKTPTDKILKLLNQLTVDDLFVHCMSQSSIHRANYIVSQQIQAAQSSAT